MNLNFAKLFPIACEEKGIESLHVQMSEILFFSTKSRRTAGFKGELIKEHFIQLHNGTSYSFVSPDEGINILSKIAAANNIIDAWKKNNDLTEQQPKEKEHNQNKNDAILFLNECVLKYC